jgi:hypothetical protein
MIAFRGLSMAQHPSTKLTHEPDPNLELSAISKKGNARNSFRYGLCLLQDSALLKTLLRGYSK